MPVEVSLTSEQQESDKNDPQANTKLQPMQWPSNFFEKKASAAGGEHSASSREQMSVTSTWCGSQRHYHHHHHGVGAKPLSNIFRLSYSPYKHQSSDLVAPPFPKGRGKKKSIFF